MGYLRVKKLGSHGQLGYCCGVSMVPLELLACLVGCFETLARQFLVRCYPFELGYGLALPQEFWLDSPD